MKGFVTIPRVALMLCAIALNGCATPEETLAFSERAAVASWADLPSAEELNAIDWDAHKPLTW